MLRFGSESTRRVRKYEMPHARVWQLLVMLVISVALMLGAWYHASRPELSPPAAIDTSGTARVSLPLASDDSDSFGVEEARAVELSRLSEFRDHSRDLEPDPYYYLLDLARQNSATWMEQNARRDLTWAHLLRDSDRYRGQLVYLKGRLRRLVVDRCGPNDYGLETRYEGWLFTEESGAHAYAVIVSEPPAGMPVGAINENVTVAAYFLGWWRHQNQQDRPTSSPVLLGKRFNWNQAPPVRPETPAGTVYGFAIGIAIAVLGLATAVLTMRRRTLEPIGTTDSKNELTFEEVAPPLEERREDS